MGWTQVFQDTFVRANGAIGNGWVGQTATATIASNALSVFNNGSQQWNGGETLRPVNEVNIGQRVVLQGTISAGGALWAVLRSQGGGGSNACYIAGIAWSGSVWNLYVEYTFGTAAAALGTVAISPAPTLSHVYQVDFSVVGTSPTTLTATITDITAGNTVVGTWTGTDSTAYLQVNGQSGFLANGPSAIGISLWTDYNYVPPAATNYTLTGPTLGTPGVASGNFTVTPNGNYTGTITPGDSGGGGTFTPSSLTWAGTSDAKTFTYTPSSIGSKVIATTSSPGLTDPGSVTLVASTNIAVNNPNIYWSPWNWYANGSTWKQTCPGGGYFKIAFTGTQLAITLDTAHMTGATALSAYVLDAYIDGATSPISLTVAAAVSGVLTFSSILSAGSHYAIVYVSSVPYAAGDDRWVTPTASIRILNILVSSTLSLAGTPMQPSTKRALCYGDSIVEGIFAGQAETGFAPKMCQLLGLEYGQIGFGSLGWTHNGNSGVPYFVNSPDDANSSWNNYSSGLSRLAGGFASLASGFIGGSPDYMFLNMGSNDILNSSSTALVRSKLTAFLAAMRTVCGPATLFCVIMPFMTGNGGYPTYVTAISGGITDYQTAHPTDSNIFTLNLGLSGYNIVNANSGDNLHPNQAGSALIATALAAIVPALPIVGPVYKTPNQTGTDLFEIHTPGQDLIEVRV